MAKNGKKQFIGTYFVKLLNGYRISLPTQFRRNISKEIIFTKGLDGALILVPTDRWEQLVKPLQTSNYFDADTRTLLRYLVASSYPASIDRQGRVVIPSTLRADLGALRPVESTLVLVGMLDFIELWSENTWKLHQEAISKQAHKIAQNFYDKKQNIA